MRFLSTLLSVTIFLLVVVVGGFFVAREALLSWGVKSFKASLVELDRAARTDYSTQCAQLEDGTVRGIPVPATVQLRFISNTAYVIEAACDQFLSKTIPISRGELGPYMTKISGTSGVIADAPVSMVELAVFEELNAEVKKILNIQTNYLLRTKIIGMENGMPSTLPAGSALGQGPVTTCAGYGYQCCRPEEAVGVGEKITGVPDCAQNCFANCVSRPVVLSFNTNPLFDIQNRTLSVSSGATVEFRYIGTASDPNALTAVIDFGDGQKSQPLAGESGSELHKYVCATGNCTYTAELKLRDTWGTESYASDVTKVTVRVQ